MQEELKQEYDSLQKISKKQMSALNFLNNKEENDKKREHLMLQLKAEKAKHKELQDKLYETDKRLKDQHQVHYRKYEKLRLIEKKIADFKKKPNKEKKVIGEEDIEIVEN